MNLRDDQIRYLLSLVQGDIKKARTHQERAKPDDPVKGLNRAEFIASKQAKIDFATEIKDTLEGDLQS